MKRPTPFPKHPLFSAIIVTLVNAFAGSVHANGAFADSGVILLSKAKPGRIIASSELPGLVVSEDGGASWHWICENALGVLATLYQRGAPPDERLYAITRKGLSRSSDGGCSWQLPGDIAARAGDVFADPGEPARVLIVAQTALGGDRVQSDVLVASNDGGDTFAAPLFATNGYSITSAESAASDPRRLYLALSSLQLQHPAIARSRNGGEQWDTLDLSLQLGRRSFIMRILAVDPHDPERFFLRLSDGARDALAVSRDAGDHVNIVQSLPAGMSAFLRRRDGSLIIASADGSAFISHDDATSFERWPISLHLRALAEADDGTLYAATNSKIDGFALASSRDDGASWQPLFELAQLAGPLACGDVAERCAASWQQQRSTLAALAGRPNDDAGAIAGGTTKTEAKPGCSIATRAKAADIPALPLGTAGVACVWLCCRRRRRNYIRPSFGRGSENERERW
jgi:hypothetical protein